MYEGLVFEDVFLGKVFFCVMVRDFDCGEIGECELGLLRYLLEEMFLFEVDLWIGDIRVGFIFFDYEK